MSQWGSCKARLVFRALLKIGWSPKRAARGSHQVLERTGYPNFVFAFHDGEEIGPSIRDFPPKTSDGRDEFLIFCLEWPPGRDSFGPPLPGRSQFPRKRRVRKVRTPQGNAPHESEGRGTRETRTDSAAERYRRWPARAQARVKWWSKSPPRIRVTGRHGKPRVVQDRTGKGLPARSFPGISRTLRKQGAPLRRGERNGRPAPQGVDRIRLTGERHFPFPRHGGGACRLQSGGGGLHGLEPVPAAITYSQLFGFK